MATEERDDVSAQLRTALRGLVPRPTGSFRHRAWQTFEQALDRHLAAKRGLTTAQTRR